MATTTTTAIGLLLLALGLSFLTATAALAWGATGHEWVSGIAVEKLPVSLPLPSSDRPKPSPR